MPLLSSIASIGTWLGTAYQLYGTVTVTTLSDFYPTVAGNMLALTAPIVLTPLITYIKPEDYDFALFQDIQQVDDRDVNARHAIQTESAAEKTTLELDVVRKEQPRLLRAWNFAIGAALFIMISMTILWPIP